MFTSTRWATAVTLGLGIGLAADAQQQPPDRKIPLVLEIVKLADTLEQGSVSIRAKKIIQDFDPCDMPQIFRLKQRGGAGIGTASQAGHKNSIEDLVRDWSGSKPPTQKELDAHQMDLVRTARVLQTLAELAPHRVEIYVPKTDAKRTAAWFQASANFKTVTGEFRDALEKADLAKTRVTAVKLQKACAGCHQVVGI